MNSTCIERTGETYIHNSVTSTNIINSTYDDMVKASGSKLSSINDICFILNYVSKDVKYVKVFDAKVVSLENNRTVQVICKTNLTRASFMY